ncbi:MAG: hypothetical protein H8K04_09490 [Nitrospira sp.]
MQLHRRLQERISHTVDTTGVAVALAILIGISLFAGGGGENSAGVGPPSPSAHMATEQMSNLGKAGVLPHRDNETDHKRVTDSSHR